MTRKEQIEQESAINAAYIGGIEIAGDFSEEKLQTYQNGFINGAEWADNNPKSPWISVKDDLPFNHKEMVKVVIEDADTYTDRVLAMTDEGILTIAYMYKPTPYSWHWSETERITHWMPIPKLQED